MSEQTPRVTGPKDFMRRAGWASIALLFVATGLGFGIYSFIQGVSQKNNPSSALNCELQPNPTPVVLKEPKIEPHEAKLTKLETKDLSTGSGATAKSGDCLSVKYYGALAASGKKFDGNYTKEQALQFAIGQQQVIAGIEVGVIGMKLDGERLIYIPANLGYGNQPQGEIPANSDLIFQVKLLKIGN